MIGECNKCTYPNCKANASYGLKQDIVPSMCIFHKHYNMRDMGVLCCKYGNCIEFPGYALIPEPNKKNKYIPPDYCSFHKLDEMEVVRNMRCIKIGCRNVASYNYERNGMGTKNECSAMCKRHRRSGMILIRTYWCKAAGCKKEATRGYEATKNNNYCVRLTYCDEHYCEPGQYPIGNKNTNTTNNITNKNKRKLEDTPSLSSSLLPPLKLQIVENKILPSFSEFVNHYIN